MPPTKPPTSFPYLTRALAESSVSFSKSLLFSREFNNAIIGTAKNASGNEVLAYDEVILVEIMNAQMLEGEDKEDEDMKADLQEAARDSVFHGLDEILRNMGKWEPVLV